MEIPAGSEKFAAELKQLLAEESASENKIRELLDKYPEKVPQAESGKQVPQAESGKQVPQAEPQRMVRRRIVGMVEVVPQAQSVEQVPQAQSVEQVPQAGTLLFGDDTRVRQGSIFGDGGTPVDDTAFQVEKQMRKTR